MKNSWMTSFSGYIRMKIVGSYTEIFLNRCIEHKISIWNIRRISPDAIVCYIALEDVKRIRPLVRQTRVKVSFIERKGMPFIARKAASRSGFFMGIIAFITLLFILSNMVWNVTIEGATPQIEHQLNQVVEDMGIKKGKFQFLLPSVEDIQQQVTSQIEEATWIGVTLNGTTYHFQVVEQTFPEKEEAVPPRHLVAKKKAIIHDIFVENGQGSVVPHDFVNKGDMLISGFIGKEGKLQTVPAKGKVLGEIWYKSNVSVPLKSEFHTLTGEKVVNHKIEIAGLVIPVYGFKKPGFSEYETNEHRSNFLFLGKKLPIQYSRKTYLEKEVVERQYNEEEGINVAIQMAREELIKNIDKDAAIMGEKVLHQTIENGKVNLMIHYQVIEDIAIPQPIIQGE